MKRGEKEMIKKERERGGKRENYRRNWENRRKEVSLDIHTQELLAHSYTKYKILGYPPIEVKSFHANYL